MAAMFQALGTVLLIVLLAISLSTADSGGGEGSQLAQKVTEECLKGTHNCSKHATCEYNYSPNNYSCRCDREQADCVANVFDSQVFDHCAKVGEVVKVDCIDDYIPTKSPYMLCKHSKLDNVTQYNVTGVFCLPECSVDSGLRVFMSTNAMAGSLLAKLPTNFSSTTKTIQDFDHLNLTSTLTIRTYTKDEKGLFINTVSERALNFTGAHRLLTKAVDSNGHNCSYYIDIRRHSAPQINAAPASIELTDNGAILNVTKVDVVTTKPATGLSNLSICNASELTLKAMFDFQNVGELKYMLIANASGIYDSITGDHTINLTICAVDNIMNETQSVETDSGYKAWHNGAANISISILLKKVESLAPYTTTTSKIYTGSPLTPNDTVTMNTPTALRRSQSSSPTILRSTHVPRITSSVTESIVNSTASEFGSTTITEQDSWPSNQASISSTATTLGSGASGEGLPLQTVTDSGGGEGSQLAEKVTEECLNGTHNCSKHATCEYNDYSPNNYSCRCDRGKADCFATVFDSQVLGHCAKVGEVVKVDCIDDYIPTKSPYMLCKHSKLDNVTQYNVTAVFCQPECSVDSGLRVYMSSNAMEGSLLAKLPTNFSSTTKDIKDFDHSNLASTLTIRTYTVDEKGLFINTVSERALNFTLLAKAVDSNGRNCAYYIDIRRHFAPQINAAPASIELTDIGGILNVTKVDVVTTKPATGLSNLSICNASDLTLKAMFDFQNVGELKYMLIANASGIYDSITGNITINLTICALDNIMNETQSVETDSGYKAWHNGAANISISILFKKVESLAPYTTTPSKIYTGSPLTPNDTVTMNTLTALGRSESSALTTPRSTHVPRITSSSVTERVVNSTAREFGSTTIMEQDAAPSNPAPISSMATTLGSGASGEGSPPQTVIEPDVNECVEGAHSCSDLEACDTTTRPFTCKCNLENGICNLNVFNSTIISHCARNGELVKVDCVDGFIPDRSPYIKCSANDVLCRPECDPEFPLRVYLSSNAMVGTLLTKLPLNLSSDMDDIKDFNHTNLSSGLSTRKDAGDALELIVINTSEAIRSSTHLHQLTVKARKSDRYDCLYYILILVHSAPRIDNAQPFQNIALEVEQYGGYVNVTPFSVTVFEPATDLSTLTICNASDPNMKAMFDIETLGNWEYMLTANQSGLYDLMTENQTIALGICAVDNIVNVTQSDENSNGTSYVAWHDGATNLTISIVLIKVTYTEPLDSPGTTPQSTKTSNRRVTTQKLPITSTWPTTKHNPPTTSIQRAATSIPLSMSSRLATTHAPATTSTKSLTTHAPPTTSPAATTYTVQKMLPTPETTHEPPTTSIRSTTSQNIPTPLTKPTIPQNTPIATSRLTTGQKPTTTAARATTAQTLPATSTMPRTTTPNMPRTTTPSSPTTSTKPITTHIPSTGSMWTATAPTTFNSPPVTTRQRPETMSTRRVTTHKTTTTFTMPGTTQTPTSTLATSATTHNVPTTSASPITTPNPPTTYILSTTTPTPPTTYILPTTTHIPPSTMTRPTTTPNPPTTNILPTTPYKPPSTMTSPTTTPNPPTAYILPTTTHMPPSTMTSPTTTPNPPTTYILSTTTHMPPSTMTSPTTTPNPPTTYILPTTTHKPPSTMTSPTTTPNPPTTYILPTTTHKPPSTMTSPTTTPNPPTTNILPTTTHKPPSTMTSPTTTPNPPTTYILPTTTHMPPSTMTSPTTTPNPPTTYSLPTTTYIPPSTMTSPTTTTPNPPTTFIPPTTKHIPPSTMTSPTTTPNPPTTYISPTTTHIPPTTMTSPTTTPNPPTTYIPPTTTHIPPSTMTSPTTTPNPPTTYSLPTTTYIPPSSMTSPTTTTPNPPTTYIPPTTKHIPPTTMTSPPTTPNPPTTYIPPTTKHIPPTTMTSPTTTPNPPTTYIPPTTTHIPPSTMTSPTTTPNPPTTYIPPTTTHIPPSTMTSPTTTPNPPTTYIPPTTTHIPPTTMTSPTTTPKLPTTFATSTKGHVPITTNQPPISSRQAPSARPTTIHLPLTTSEMAATTPKATTTSARPEPTNTLPATPTAPETTQLPPTTYASTGIPTTPQKPAEAIATVTLTEPLTVTPTLTSSISRHPGSQSTDASPHANVPPKVYISQSMTVMEGDSAIIHCTVNTTLPFTIQWFNRHGHPIRQGINYRIYDKTQTLKIISVRHDVHNGHIKCVASGEKYPASNASTTLAVLVKPFISPKPPAKRSAFEGTKVEIGCSYGGWPKPNVTWHRIKNGSKLASYPGYCKPFWTKSAANNVFLLVINDLQTCNGGVYRCSVATGNQSVASDVNLTVFEPSNFELSVTFSQTNISADNSLANEVKRTVYTWLQGSRPNITNITLGELPQNIGYSATVRFSVSTVFNDSLARGNVSLSEGFRAYIFAQIKRNKDPELLQPVQDSLYVISFDVCPNETLVSNTGSGSFLWPETTGANTVTLECPVGLHGVGKAIATRTCLAPSKKGEKAEWEEANITACPSQTTKLLQELSQEINITEPDVLVTTSTELANLTARDEFSSKDDVGFAATILLGLSDAADGETLNLSRQDKENVASTVLVTVDNILNVPADVIQSEPAAEIIQSVEKLVKILDVQEDKPFLLDEENIGLAVSCPSNLAATQGFQMDGSLPSSNFSVGDLDVLAKESQGALAFDIPPAALEKAKETLPNTSSGCANPKAQFILYRTDSLFQDKSLSSSTQVFSSVISAQAGESSLSNLSDPVVIAFNVSTYNNTDLPQPIPPGTDSSGVRFKCVYWDRSTTFGRWSTEGCNLTRSEGRAVCQCNHLTSFALLVSRTSSVAQPSGPKSAAQVGISVVSYIGCALSMCGLLATIIIISVLKKQRSHSHQKLMIGLCTTLFLVLLLFVSAVEPAAWNRGLCQTIAFLMHYLLLMAFMWMSADATLLYTQLVTVFGGLSIGNLLNYMLLLIFGLPLLIVVVTAASTQMEAYGNEHHCWIADNAVFYAAFFAPMCITLLYNMIILITVIRSLHHRSKNVKTASRKKDTSGKVYLLRISVSLSLMLGLTWLFGMLTVLTDHIAVQYIFALFNTLQGLFIFLHTIQSKDVRKEWTESFSSSSRRRSTRDTFASGSYPLVTIRRLVDMGDSRIGKFRNSFRSSLSKRDSQRPKTSTAEAQTTSAATTQDITSSRSTDRPVATDSSSTVYASIAPARSRASTYTEPTSQTTCSPGDTVIVGALPPENTPISSDDHQIIYTLLSFDDVPVKGKVTVFEENQPVAAVEVHETTWNQGTAQGVEETIAESIPAKREWISSSV